MKKHFTNKDCWCKPIITNPSGHILCSCITPFGEICSDCDKELDKVLEAFTGDYLTDGIYASGVVEEKEVKQEKKRVLFNIKYFIICRLKNAYDLFGQYAKQNKLSVKKSKI